MATRIRPISLALCCGLSWACASPAGVTPVSPSLVVADAAATTPSRFRPALTDTPAHPGSSGVFRLSDGSGFYIYDLEHGLLVLHGSSTSFVDICAGTTPPIFEPGTLQTIESASGLHWMFTDSTHPVQIYPAVPFGCPYLAVTPRIAAGAARLIRVDNDLFGDDRAMNAFGWQASGVLDDLVNGGSVHYNEIVRTLADPRTGDVTELIAQVQLH